MRGVHFCSSQPTKPACRLRNSRNLGPTERSPEAAPVPIAGVRATPGATGALAMRGMVGCQHQRGCWRQLGRDRRRVCDRRQDAPRGASLRTAWRKKARQWSAASRSTARFHRDVDSRNVVAISLDSVGWISGFVRARGRVRPRNEQCGPLRGSRTLRGHPSRGVFESPGTGSLRATQRVPKSRGRTKHVALTLSALSLG